jgi:hypothetical protein
MVEDSGQESQASTPSSTPSTPSTSSFETPPPRITGSGEDGSHLSSKKKQQRSATRIRGPTRQNRVSVPKEVDGTLLKLLLSPKKNLPLSYLANQDTVTFGEPGSSQRKKVSNRLNYLKGIQQKDCVQFLEIAKLHRVNFDGTLQEPTLLPSLPARPPTNRRLTLTSPSSVSSSTIGTRKESPAPPPASIIMSSSSRHHHLLKHPCFTHDLEFNLDFDKPEKNPFGIMVFRANAVEHDGQLIDKVTIMKPLYDPRDRKSLKATLDEDGTGITYTELSSPSYLFKDADLIHETEKEHTTAGLACEKTCQAHQVAANSIQSKEELRLQRVRLNFPDEVSCKIFTQADKKASKKGNKLKNNFRMVEVKIGESADCENLMWEAPYVVWVFVINSEARHLKRQESEDSDDDFKISTKRMNKVSMVED